MLKRSKAEMTAWPCSEVCWPTDLSWSAGIASDSPSWSVSGSWDLRARVLVGLGEGREVWKRALRDWARDHLSRAAQTFIAVAVGVDVGVDVV